MRTERHQAAIDELEVRLLRLLQIEQIVGLHTATTGQGDIVAVAEEVVAAMRDWREAVGR